MDKRDALKQAQDAFNLYMREHVRPALGLSKDEENNLSFAEHALRIKDRAMRRKYVELALSLNQANIDFYRGDATLLRMPERNQVVPVVLALFAAAIGHQIFGAVGALAAAGAGYWFGSGWARNDYRSAVQQADEHNAHVAGWKEFVDLRSRDVEELQELQDREVGWHEPEAVRRQ